MRIFHCSTMLLFAGLLTGCMSAEDPRIEGIAFEGGNAIAHNSALQIIDPWPRSVQQTDLAVPAERPKAEDSAGDSAAAGSGLTE